MQAPNGWFSENLVIWNDLDKRGFVSKGFVLDVPDLRHASEHTLDGFYQSVRHFLHTLDESTRCKPDAERAALYAAQLEKQMELTGRLNQTGWL